MSEYIKSMSGSIRRSRGFGRDSLELAVTISFDAKQFSKIAKKGCPLAAGMAQIKNVVLDATGVRGIPSYQPESYSQRWPRARKGLKTITVYFEISDFNARQLGVNTSEYSIYQSVDLNTTLEATRNDGHLFAKAMIVERISN